MPKAAIQWFSFALAASPAIIPLLAILHYGIDFPFWDQWDPGLSGMFIKAHEHQLTFGDLFAQHNEHRILVPRLIYLVLGLATRWNTIAEMMACWAFACVASAGVLWLCRRTTGAGLFLWFLCNLCIFSLAQWENWLGGVGMVNVMGVMWAIATVVAAASSFSPPLRAGGAMLCAAAATFTCGSGLLCWPIGAVVLGWSNSLAELKLKRWMLLAWMAGFVLTVSLFFYGYDRGSGERVVSAGLGDRLAYVLAFAGAAYGPALAVEWSRTALLVGGALVVLYAAIAGYFVHAWRVRHDHDLCGRILVWLALGSYTILSGAMASLMRAHGGSSQATSSRYATFSMLLSIALVNLVSLVCADQVRRHANSSAPGRLWLRLPAAGAAILIWLHISLSLALVTFIDGTMSSRGAMKAAMLLVDVLPDNPWLRPDGFPKYPGIAERAHALSRIGYLHPPLISTNNAQTLRAPESDAAGESTKWGTIQQVQVSPDRTTLFARGWAISLENRTAAHAVFLTIENERKEPIIVAFGAVSEARPELSQQLGDARYATAGWAMTFPLSQLPASFRGITLAAWSFDIDSGKAYKLGGQVVLTR